MIALDTNVLVRFLVEDDPAQSARAAALVATTVEEDGTLWVSDVVVCELAWVLSGAYGCARGDIASTLAELLRARHLSFRDPDGLARALRAFEAGRADLADYLIREDARDAGCEAVVTFDRALLREEGFVAP